MEHDRSVRPGESGSAPEPRESVAGVRLTRPDRILYRRQGITKRELATYYERASKWILAHAADRPLTLVRCPRGAGGDCFFQRHATAGLPPSVRRAQVPEGDRTATGLCVDSAEGLVALAQIGCLEIHPWNARVGELGTPDRMIFDLDPSPGVPWSRTVEAAEDVRAALVSRGLRSFAKLTGGRGIHVVVPLSPEHGGEEVLSFSRGIAAELVRRRPSRYTARAAKTARKGKILIDVLRNARGATAVGAYSPRARAGAPVSLPVAWDELGPDLRSDAFPIPRALERIERMKEDPWTGFHRLSQTLPRDARPVPRDGGESQS